MAPEPTEDVVDSDSDVEFEDVPLRSAQASASNNGPTNGIHAATTSISLQQQPWRPTLSLPQQRTQPIPAGSETETQLRGRLSAGIDRITYRQMKSEMGMDAPESSASSRRYESFKDFAFDVDGMIDMLWASATREYPCRLAFSHFHARIVQCTFLAVYSWSQMGRCRHEPL